jgi:hypothetical protein
MTNEGDARTDPDPAFVFFYVCILHYFLKREAPETTVADSLHFGVDPDLDPRFHVSD